MESENPMPEKSAPSQQSEPPINPEMFRWNSMIAPPWDPGTYYFFILPDTVFYEAPLIGYPIDFAKNFHLAMSHFCAASTYAGLHKSIERIGNELILQGQQPGEATLFATLAVQLIQHGILNFLPDFTHVYIHATDQNADDFPYPTSPMHAWAFIQACDFLEKDIIPIFQLKDGSDSYPFGEIADIKNALQQTRTLLTGEIAEIMKNINPYKQIADFRALNEIPHQKNP